MNQPDHEDVFVKTDDDSQCVGWSKYQLTYIGRDCVKIPPVLCKLYGPKAIRLDLSYNFIDNLEGLEKFTALEELILDNNILEDGTKFPSNKGLFALSLNKNKFTNLEDLITIISKAYPNLTYFSLLGNPACPDQLSNYDKDDDDYRRYRYFVIYHLPKLCFLDSTKVRNSERLEAARVGEFMCVVRPGVNPIYVKSTIELVDTDVIEAHIETGESTSSHSSAYGKLRYKYTGKHSEGNRFIRNQHL